MSTYFDNLCDAMSLLSKQSNFLTIGQGVINGGHGIYHTLKHIPMEQRLEFPVAEAMQTSFTIGLSLQGYLPLGIYPRFNFLLSATDQLVNHLDKLYNISCGDYNPKVIIRVAIGGKNILNSGLQHQGDFSQAFFYMLPNINVVRLDSKDDIIPAYQDAINSLKSTLLIEWADFYAN